MALSVFAFENYYGPADLARQTLDPAVYDDMKAIYERSYKGQEGLKTDHGAQRRLSLLDYLTPELRDPVRFGISRLWHACWPATKPTARASRRRCACISARIDEVVKPMIGMLAAAYQAVLIGNLSDQSGQPRPRPST